MNEVVELSRDELLALSVRFREAVEKVLRDLPRVPSNLDRFPNGCCGQLSWMLGQILNDRFDDRVLYVSANHCEGNGSHGWLRCGNIVIDVTGDQFTGRPAVYAGVPDSWFDQWEIDEPMVGPALYEMGYDLDADRVYERVCTLLGN